MLNEFSRRCFLLICEEGIRWCVRMTLLGDQIYRFIWICQSGLLHNSNVHQKETY
jgi:hypothetical protein